MRQSIIWILEKNNNSYNKKNLLCTYSATTVFPADVWADTNTDCKLSMHSIASFWNGSNIKLYCLAGSEVSGKSGEYSWFGGIATSCVQPSCVSNVWMTIRELRRFTLKTGF